MSAQADIARLPDDDTVLLLFVAHLPAALWVCGTQDRIVNYASPACERLVGRKVAAGDSIEAAIQAVPPDDRPALRAAMDAHVHGGLDHEFRFLHPDGSVRWVRARTFGVRDDGGSTRWIAGVMEDITERHRISEALHESEMRFRALVEQSVAGIYLIEANCFTYINPHMSEMLGYTLEELRGIDVRDLLVEETARCSTKTGGSARPVTSARCTRPTACAARMARLSISTWAGDGSTFPAATCCSESRRT